MRSLFILTIAALLALPSLPAGAQLYTYSWYEGDLDALCRGANAAPGLAAYDADRDGVITEREFAAYGTAGEYVSLFHSIDADHDGRITRAELAQYREVGDCR